MLNVFAHPMAAALIAAQARVPTLLVGPPGCGKTLLMEGLAAALGRRFITLVGSQCSPEDIGGLPVPDHVKFLCRQMPMSYAEALLTPGGFLFLDEWLATSPGVMAAMLCVIQSKKAGDLQLDHDTMIVAACNPVEMTPNGTPLTPPVANRFFSANWETDNDEWLDGLVECKWTAPAVPLVPADYESMVPKWGTIVQQFHRRTGCEFANVVPEDDSQWAFPTQRSWRNAIHCLAAADAAGADLHSDNSFVRKLVVGNVGKVATDTFVQFKSSLDLVDPLALLDGTETFTHNDDRPDITLTVAGAVTSAACSSGTFTPDRWNAAAKFLGEIGTTASPEIALRFAGLLKKGAVTNRYQPKPAALKPLVELGAMLVIPKAM